jgi:beta propeller repeat protein
MEYTMAMRVSKFLLSISFFLFLISLTLASASPDGTSTLITLGTPSTDQVNPVIFGTRIVWDDPYSTLGYIFVYDISTGNITPVTDRTYPQQNPDISNDLIIWEDGRRPAHDIFLYNLSDSTELRITGDDSVDASSPAISYDKIVWQDFRNGDWDIYMYDLSEGREYLLTPDTAGSNQQYPAISGDLVVWQDDRNSAPNGDVEIFMNDTSTWTESQITPDNGLGVGADGSTDGAWQGVPAVFGNKIVWEDNRNLDPVAFWGTPNIYMDTLGTGEQRISDNLTSDYYSSFGLTVPRIDGDRVVWLDKRYHAEGDIYLNDTSVFPAEQIAVSNTSYQKDHPGISANRIVWAEQNYQGKYDIFLFTLGTPQVCPSVTFTEDVISGGAPLTVSFSDTTAITRLSHWYWDFGDGTVDYSENPVHQYDTEGSYRVNLTVSDEYCRNISSSQIITVGGPVADFVAAPRTGLVPLSIQFNDTSAGSPSTFDWDFENDGIVDSTARNATHVYAVPGTYTVRLDASNAYGTGTRIRNAYITALAGAHSIAVLPVEGIIIDGRFGGQFLTYNSAIVGIPVLPSPAVLISHPPASYGWQNITFTTSDSIGFSDAGNGTYFGNVSDSSLQTIDIPATGFSSLVGNPVYVSDRMTLGRYPSSGSLNTEIWESATASDNSTLSSIAISSGYTSVDAVGFSTRFSRNSLGTLGSSTINMSISSAWVAGTGGSAAGRSNTSILAYGTDPMTGNLIGTVLATRYRCSDGSLDYFQADIPAQYSYFSNFFITQLSGSGNPFQLITLSVASHVNPPALNSNPPSDSDSGMPAGGGAAGKIAIPTTTPTPPPTPVPADPGRTVKVYTNANGVVTQVIRLQSTDGRATVFISEGIVAKDASGNPLSLITIKALPSGSLPKVAAGSAFAFAGMAYEIGPDGATFSPPISLSFTLPQAQWGQDYSVKSFDQKTGTWQDLPTAFDAATGAITAQVSHLCTFALLAEPRAAPGTPGTPPSTPVPAPAVPEVTAQPPSTAVSIFTSMMGWVVALVVNNFIPVLAFIFLGVAGYLVMLGRFPGSGQ